METKKDGKYFLELHNKEKSRILKLADDAEKELENVQIDETDSKSSEDTSGLIRSVIGKARLLATDKFKQFQGLCEESVKLNDEGPNKIQLDDLQGFWDMMMIQVESVDAAFKELEDYRKNGWKKPIENNEIRKAKRPLSNKSKNALNIPSKKAATIETNPEIAKKREEQRKKLNEMKLKFKNSAEKSDSTEGDENLAFIC